MNSQLMSPRRSINDRKNSLGDRLKALMFSPNKRGQLGLDTVRSVILFLLILVVTVIAVFLALNSLQNANLFTTGSQTANDTNDVINNVTSGATQFFANVPTVFVILGAVVIILAVTLILVAVNRFGRSSETGGL